MYRQRCAAVAGWMICCMTWPVVNAPSLEPRDSIWGCSVRKGPVSHANDTAHCSTDAAAGAAAVKARVVAYHKRPLFDNRQPSQHG